ncbi:MAG TPA: hypothetical protein VG693_11130 [Actinomycetes bacterium]|nr:hypothetical protein [Actinomycetes bacterium]
MDRLLVYAKPFVAAGLAVLVFDDRGWGASDGYPADSQFELCHGSNSSSLLTES